MSTFEMNLPRFKFSIANFNLQESFKKPEEKEKKEETQDLWKNFSKKAVKKADEKSKKNPKQPPPQPSLFEAFARRRLEIEITPELVSYLQGLKDTLMPPVFDEEAFSAIIADYENKQYPKCADHVTGTSGKLQFPENSIVHDVVKVLKHYPPLPCGTVDWTTAYLNVCQQSANHYPIACLVVEVNPTEFVYMKIWPESVGDFFFRQIRERLYVTYCNYETRQYIKILPLSQEYHSGFFRPIRRDLIVSLQHQLSEKPEELITYCSFNNFPAYHSYNFCQMTWYDKQSRQSSIGYARDYIDNNPVISFTCRPGYKEQSINGKPTIIRWKRSRTGETLSIRAEFETHTGHGYLDKNIYSLFANMYPNFTMDSPLICHYELAEYFNDESKFQGMIREFAMLGVAKETIRVLKIEHENEDGVVCVKRRKVLGYLPELPGDVIAMIMHYLYADFHINFLTILIRRKIQSIGKLKSVKLIKQKHSYK